ncbi:aminobutyraldehyde dehydrogenase [Gordonia sp. TBRC 11910]|uniref:Aminobutyraldehyde dehydrogenase n=1 Tax=Gordonia asplenii TaxID=2725283 RepID=A0A848KZU3_9ACTN|nr:aminobutyraldehyde dehydrogenase [Gordonia asplenii]NMO01721.1 aminobutyraldehyde dehydrogenase [Gordonia asplenii]
MSAPTHPDVDVRRVDAAPISAAELPPARLFIDGAFVESAGELVDIVDPSTEDVITAIPFACVDEVDRAVTAARAAAFDWGRTVPRERAEVLYRIADRVAENADLLVRLESANTGKPLSTSRDDVDGTIDTFRFMAGAVRAGTTLAAGDYAQDHLSVLLREPLGVVGVITPWNYPLLMAAWKLAPILAAGNTVVIKPSEQTPLTTLKFAELVGDLLPAGVLNVMPGTGPTVGERLAAHPDVDMIALTGSVGSGRAVARTAAETLKRVHLELGGKAPVVVFADADLPATAQALRVASFYNAGQECGAACRVLVESSVAREFTELLAEQVRDLVVGTPSADDVEVGPMVSRAHFDRVRAHLARAAEQGATAVTGGAVVEGTGYFVAPTVLADIPAGADCVREEIFGPVITVETFDDEAEAIARANDTPFGLSASVWTENARRSLDVAARVDAGTVWVNSHLVLANEVPWGGFKGSGYGRDLSIYALDDYSRTKHVMHNHGR